MNLGNGKGPKRTGRSSTYVAPPTSLSTNFFQKLYHPRPAPLAESSELQGPQSITNSEASGSNSPFPPPISPKPQIARMRKKVRGKPMTKSLLSLANRQVFPFHKWTRSWASAHAPWKNKFASSNKPIASAASDQLKAETGKSWNEDFADTNPHKAKSWTSPTATSPSTASNSTPSRS